MTRRRNRARVAVAVSVMAGAASGAIAAIWMAPATALPSTIPIQGPPLSGSVDQGTAYSNQLTASPGPILDWITVISSSGVSVSSSGMVTAPATDPPGVYTVSGAMTNISAQNGWTFTLTVKGAAAQLDDLQTAVTGVGPGTSLSDKVSIARSDQASDDVPGACAVLRAFAQELEAQSGKSIPAGDAQTLNDAAKQIEALLDC